MSDESIKSKNESDSNANEMSSDANSEQSSENNTYDDYTKGYNEKDSNRQKKPKQKSPKPFPNKLSSTLPKKKWDMDYVNKNLDDAHHLVAKTNPELDISTKRYYPECFYGYDNMTMFLNDVMPSLRKMKKNDSEDGEIGGDTSSDDSIIITHRRKRLRIESESSISSSSSEARKHQLLRIFFRLMCFPKQQIIFSRLLDLDVRLPPMLHR
ncbi:hypothetical protein CWI38_2387p0010 [Hamiltosporidium tvaerminnensis]|uniref:Uncharacterized protein n=1 Tax=Hamiltosporidium tvaerminnensis TaxID=1176355 RepID=A0A4V2JWG7_9MICR|nr:hypothetical protein CWI38_2387p0010 [Hamiltosporidium tvaerminnensis]